MSAAARATDIAYGAAPARCRSDRRIVPDRPRTHATNAPAARYPGMERLWFITNPGSGSASQAKCDAIEAVFVDRALALAGRTLFPDEPLPSSATLAAANVDVVVLFAGDGTINAALCALGNWDGAFLILPGGTMNMLAKTLHASLDPVEIVHAAHRANRRIALPFIEAGAHRAFVGVILGPAGSWFHAREVVRKGRIKRFARAVRLAWQRTFRNHVRVAGAASLRRAYQAIFLSPRAGGLDVAAVDARAWRAIVELGWNWVSGEWVAARAVTQEQVATLRVLGRKPVLALFDGEPASLPRGTALTGAMSRACFISTRGEDA